mmetsp:Transcript_121631/g.236651  ORF Transcript_121631/g.236651 Transcript_121631/m.236651 type:complete len:180 (-) Transcript_121631:861-1400(-)
MTGHAIAVVTGSLHETVVVENAARSETKQQLQPHLQSRKIGIVLPVGIWFLLVTRPVGDAACQKIQQPRVCSQIIHRTVIGPALTAVTMSLECAVHAESVGRLGHSPVQQLLPQHVLQPQRLLQLQGALATGSALTVGICSSHGTNAAGNAARHDRNGLVQSSPSDLQTIGHSRVLLGR